MSQRFFVYPLFFVALMQLVPLLRSGHARWYAAQIAQLVLILLASLGAGYFEEDFIWVIVAWTLFVAFAVGPRLVLRTAARHQLAGAFELVARQWQLASRLVWGHLGRLYRAHARMLELWASGDRQDAELLFEQLVSAPMPRAMRGEVRTWKLSLLVASREFGRAVEFYEGTENWGTLSAATAATLLAARAYAEIGQVERALRRLQFAALSPRTIGPLGRQLWMVRVCVVALAGDEAELESLLRAQERAWRRRDLVRFAAYWRGRCALMREDQATAVQQLARAFSLTYPRQRSWRDTIAAFLHRAEALPDASSGDGVARVAAGSAGYVAAKQALRAAEQQTSAWRALMHVGRPEPTTLALLALLAAAFVTDEIVFGWLLQQPLWLLLGNVPEEVRQGEWWRPFTALFLHANWLHLAMNGTALWLFGSSVEKTIWRWRFAVIFLFTGAAGNLMSVLVARYDVSVGASGGIFGVIGAFAVAVYRLDAPMYASVRRRLLLLLGVMVACDLTIGGLEPQVDNLAHAGGFIAGLALATLLWPRRTGGATRAVDAAPAL